MTFEKFSFSIEKSARDNYALRDTAMNREIAPRGGNFRGVCPIIGRLRRSVRCVYRHAMISYRPEEHVLKPVFFMSRNDTHG